MPIWYEDRGIQYSSEIDFLLTIAIDIFLHTNGVLMTLEYTGDDGESLKMF